MATLLSGLKWRNASTQRVLQVLDTVTIAAEHAEGDTTLDMDWHPKLSWAQAALCALVAGLPATGIWHALGASRPLLALAACALAFLVTAYWGRTALLEAQYTTKQRLEAELADHDSHFRSIENIQVHVKSKQPLPQQRGAGQRPAVACHCYHGFGSNTFSWSRVQEQLAGRLRAQVTAHDMPGFGLTQRPEDVSGYCLTFNGRLGRLIIDHELATHHPTSGPKPPASPPPRVLIGHSLGAACAALEAVSTPDEIAALVLVAPAILALPTPQLTQSQLIPIPASSQAPFDARACASTAAHPHPTRSYSSLSSSDAASDTSSSTAPPDDTPLCRLYVSLPRSLNRSSFSLETPPTPDLPKAPGTHAPPHHRPSPLRLASALVAALHTPHHAIARQPPVSYPLSRSSSLASMFDASDDPDATPCAAPLSCLPHSTPLSRSFSAAFSNILGQPSSPPSPCQSLGAAQQLASGAAGIGAEVCDEEAEGAGEAGQAWRLAGLVVKWVAAVLLVALVVLRPLVLPLLRSVVRTRGFWTLILRRAYFDKSRVTAEVVDAYRLPQLVKGFDRGVHNVLLALSHGHSAFSLLRMPFGQDATGGAASSAADLAQHLAAVVERHSIPVLLVQGEDDAITPASNTARLARCLPRCHLAVLERCGHMPQEEMPDRFVELVSAFVETHVQPL